MKPWMMDVLGVTSSLILGIAVLMLFTNIYGLIFASMICVGIMHKAQSKRDELREQQRQEVMNNG